VTSRRDYTAFGEESVTPERAAGLGYAGQSETRKGYTGYEKDNESGLEFAQARYYNATHGRFTSVDPLTASATIRNPQTFNRYTYVLNSPYKFTDPLGLIPETTGACGNRCRNSDGGELGFIGLYSDNGSTIVIADEQQAEEPEPPPTHSAEQNPDTLIHEAVHQTDTPPTLLGDAVYEPADGRLGGGEVRSTVFPPGVPALDVFVNTTDYYAAFTMRIAERSTGENRSGYEYEISYDGQSPREAVQGRQTVGANGVIEIGSYLVRSQTTGPDQPLKPFYAGDINRTWTGTITIYGSNGDKVGTSGFEASVKTVDASVGDHRVSIVETSRTVGNRTWSRPSP